jgi:hypothetical protein
MARELSVPVTGFVVQGVVAAPNDLPEGQLLHMDMHLHRSEVTYVERNDKIAFKDSLTAEGNGSLRLFREWAEAIAEEFVRKTRFDPLHEAASEQELYNRLPHVLQELQQNPAIDLQMKGGSRTFHVTLTQDLFIQKITPVFQQIGQQINHMLSKHGKADSAVIVQVSHRLARLPGVKTMLSRDRDWLVVELEPGRGALGTLQYWHSSSDSPGKGGAPFLTSRPLPTFDQEHLSSPKSQEMRQPTHLLYRDLAYPITDRPLFIGQGLSVHEPGLVIQKQNDPSLSNYCAIQVQETQVMLKNLSSQVIFVDENPVKDKAVLQLGQVIRLGTPGETLRLIACHEIP